MTNFFFCFLFLLFSCGKQPVSNDKTVLVSVPPYAYFVEKIAGSSVSIKILTPPGSNPHIYEPTPSEIIDASNASLWIRIGEPFERKVLQVLQQRNNNLAVLDLTNQIPLISMTEHNHCSHDHGDGHDEHHGDEGKDRHIWLSPRLAKDQAIAIAKALISTFPGEEEIYNKNLEGLLNELNDLDQLLTEKLRPFKDEAILVSHPAFGYFCNDYNLHQIAIECEGKDPLPRQVGEILESTKNWRVRCVITQPQYSNKGALLIANQLKLSVYSIDPYEQNFIALMNQLADDIAQ